MPRIGNMKPGDTVIYQEFGHACAVFYKKKRHELVVLAAGTKSVIVVWSHERGLTREIELCALGERP